MKIRPVQKYKIRKNDPLLKELPSQEIFKQWCEKVDTEYGGSRESPEFP